MNDLVDTPEYIEARELFALLRMPGSGLPFDIAELNCAPSGDRAVFTGSFANDLDSSPVTRICAADLHSGDWRVLTMGPGNDRLPKFCPIGRTIAFLSDRSAQGNFQLYLYDSETKRVTSAPFVDGWVEYFHWSPDGSRILLAVAGHGADVSGGQGAIASRRASNAKSSWMPHIEGDDDEWRWRSAWIYDLSTGKLSRAAQMDINIWEVVWCGNSHLAAVASPGPKEGLWYSAHLYLIDIVNGDGRALYQPTDQLGWPASSPSGHCVAVVEAICSDRWLVAGRLALIDVRSGSIEWIETNAVEITHVEWRSETKLLLAGHRGAETVIGQYDTAASTFSETWVSAEKSAGTRYATAAGFGPSGDCGLITDGFCDPPEIAVVQDRQYRTVHQLKVNSPEHFSSIAQVEALRWTAPDGLELDGWLLHPVAKRPFPLLMHVHGGPISMWRPMWLGRRFISALILLKRGIGLFLPNPRGSAGRGQDFARRVVGDMGGLDTHDYLSGLDMLTGEGLVDPSRIGVTGGSYGGYMSSWLITQDQRFAAAMPVAPVTNMVSQHLVSNIPHFVKMFLNDDYTNVGGLYYTRSPIAFAHQVNTPTLHICGALDRCTPPGEAVQFHSALLEHGVKSTLAVYPEEGHGIRKMPAAIDFAARTVAWFSQYLRS